MKIRTLLPPILATLVPLGVFTLILSLDLPAEIGLGLRYDFLTIVIPFLFINYLTMRISGWRGWGLGLSVMLTVYGLTLTGLWSSGVSEPSIIGGLLPWSDANGFYQGALRLLDGALLPSFAGQRPLFSGFLASFLVITNRNLQLTLVILAAITAISCYIAAYEIRRTHGALAGAFFLTLLFTFCRRYMGTTLSENLGVTFGALGLTLLWRGIPDKNPVLILSGIFMTSLAIVIRPGAIVILPALIIWAGWYLRHSRSISWRIVGIGSAAIAFSFIINLVLVRTLAEPGTTAFSKTAVFIYSLTKGGKGWQQIYQDHPEIMQMPEEESSRMMPQIILDTFRADPAMTFTGIFKTWKAFFSPDIYGGFGFFNGLDRGMARRDNSELITVIGIGLYFLSAVGLFTWFWRRQDAYMILMWVSALGILLSVPLLPPLDLMRLHAATIPFMAILPSMGLAVLVQTANQRLLPSLSRSLPVLKNLKAPVFDSPPEILPTNSLLIISGILPAIMIIGPLMIKGISHAPLSPDETCPSDTEMVYIQKNPGSYILLLEDNTPSQIYPPGIHINQFTNALHDFMYTEVMVELEHVQPDTIITTTHDMINNRTIWLIGERQILDNSPSPIPLCGSWTTLPKTRPYNFFYAARMAQ